jgi:hypothetical protein
MTTPAPNPPAPDDERPDGKQPAGDTPAAGKPLPRKASSPLFKIAPADPTNAFDFEDVADN